MTIARIGSLAIHKGQAMAERDRAVTLEIRGNRDALITVNLQELRAALGDDPIQRERLLRELRPQLDDALAQVDNLRAGLADTSRDLIESQKREKHLWKAFKKRERMIEAFRLVVKEMSR